MSQKVRDLMSSNPITMEGGHSIFEAAQKMREADVGDVLVTRDGALAGILTDRDIVVRCVATQGDPGATPISEVCSEELATLSPDDDSDNAVKLMAKKAVRRVPVVEGGKPVGILSLGDLAEARDGKSALAGISAAPANH